MVVANDPDARFLASHATSEYLAWQACRNRMKVLIMNLDWLDVFREVAVRGSFTAAAQALRYTQSAVSRQISALEADTGTILFDRARGVRLTEEGACLLEHADAVLGRLATARRELAALREPDTGRVRIGAFPTATTVLVPRAMAVFHERHPSVALSLSEGLTPMHVSRLRDGELDVAVISAQDGRPVEAERLELRHLVDDPMLVAIPRDHRLAARRTLRLAELADEPWIAGSATVEETLIGMCLRSGFQPRIHYVVREWNAKHGLVAAGLGITLVSGIAASATRPDILIKRLHPDDVPVRAVYAATLGRAAVPAAVEEFLRLLAEVVSQLRGELAERSGRRSSARTAPARARPSR